MACDLAGGYYLGIAEGSTPSRIHTVRTLLALALFVCAGSFVHAGDVKETKSAFESNPKGFVDILPGPDLKGWKRVGYPAGTKLSDRNCWSVDTSTKTLVCDGVGIHEMLLYDKELRDCIFHVEWRFQKLDKDAKYNSGIYVRNSADGKIWHQAQVGSKNVGFIFGDTLVDGVKKRVKEASNVPQRGKEAGEWNVYEITCKGKEITLWINGAVTCRWTDCPVPAGYIGLEAEFYKIEFKNMKLKELK